MKFSGDHVVDLVLGGCKGILKGLPMLLDEFPITFFRVSHIIDSVDALRLLVGHKVQDGGRFFRSLSLLQGEVKDRHLVDELSVKSSVSAMRYSP